MMFSLKLTDLRILNGAVNILADFITEATFSIQKEGIKLIAMDPANISMVVLTILPSAFVEYAVDEPEELTVNLESLKQALKRAKPTETIALTSEKSKLKLTIAGASSKKFFIPLLDRESKERKVPALEFMATAELNASEFRDYIDDLSFASEAATFELDKNTFTLSSGDTGNKVTVEVNKGNDALHQLNAKDAVKSIYSIEYLKKMARSASLADVVTVQLSSDYPLKLDFKSINKLQLSFILAPRIENK
ncbi:MAG TPA: proliferating cell nuclear antigen (pcna) [Nanoarchaeota archaeon]|nr:proliferating cell nuclear antigen (pcna) [Nanoarchaeota archaeon]